MTGVDGAGTGRAELDFAIIGAQKSASTFVHHCLRNHPQIDIPSVESRTFEDPLYSRDGVAAVERLFGPRRDGVLRGIKRPDHLADPLVPDRLHAAAPRARLVVVLRDPVSRAVSGYVDYARLGFLPLLPLDEAFERLLAGDLTRTHPRAADVLEYGRYGAHLARWLERFPREQLVVLLQDDLLADPVGTVKVLLDFLEVDASGAEAVVAETPRANASTYDPRRIRLQRSRNRFMFRYSTDLRRREPRRMSWPGYLYAGAATLVDRRVLSRLDRAPAPSLSAEIEARLRAVYADDRERLETVVPRVPWE